MPIVFSNQPAGNGLASGPSCSLVDQFFDISIESCFRRELLALPIGFTRRYPPPGRVLKAAMAPYRAVRTRRSMLEVDNIYDTIAGQAGPQGFTHAPYNHN